MIMMMKTAAEEMPAIRGTEKSEDDIYLFFVSCRTTIPGVVLVETSAAVVLVVLEAVGWVLVTMIFVVVLVVVGDVIVVGGV